MKARISFFAGCIFGCLFVQQISAAPWLSPGDIRARYALQKLADRGHLNRTVSTWPMMWADAGSALDSESVDSDIPSIGAGKAYLGFERHAQSAVGFRGEVRLSGTTDPGFVRDFQSAPRDNATLDADVQWQGDAWAAGISSAGVLNPEDGKSLRFDGSYLAGTAANWVFGVGAIDRWWGPGWQSSLVLSSNARPVPAVWLNRKEATAPESRWLSWIGPWQLTVLAGQLEEERAIPDARLIGMRLTFRPIDGLDIGFSRMIQWGGEGRPETLRSLGHALIGRDNGQDGQANDPGNQLGSIDARYGFGIGRQTAGVYLQLMGEDEAGAFPARKSWLLGTDLTSQLGRHEQQWFIEYANTLADDFIGEAMPNITYDHSIYQSGYRYYGRSTGSSFDGDAKALTLGGYQFFAGGSNLGLTLTWADLNIDGAYRAVSPDDSIYYAVPVSNQRVALAKISFGTEVLNGWLDLSGQIADNNIQLMGGEKDRWSLAASWRYRF
ncbi:capsule assembly Wzi family protein [Marinobacter sp. V034]|uniref:capsule assembly Wzi family protein n=1 Tax=Marinobacter sp. V034 TaxID=3459610 RepID=UPI0040450677